MLTNDWKTMSYHNVKAYKLPDSYVAYDYETSDLYERGGEIIEIGAVKVIDRIVVDDFDELCAFNGQLNPKATAKNHITSDMLDGKRPLSAVFSDFVSFVGELPLVGFNNHKFDDAFTERECTRLGIQNLVSNGSIDAMSLHGGATLASCCEEYGLRNPNAHRAASDARVTHELFEGLRAKVTLESTDVRDISAKVIGKELEGEIVSFTNESDFFPKRACQTLALSHGAELSNNVTKKVTLLVNLSDHVSGNALKAEKYGIKTITGKEFLELIGEPTDRPVRIDTLHTGSWMSELSEETVLMVRRELGLPVKKSELVYYAPNGSSVNQRVNSNGITIPTVQRRLSTSVVSDFRVLDTCNKCGMVTLEIKISTSDDPIVILAPFFESMQHGEEYFLRQGAAERTGDDE